MKHFLPLCIADVLMDTALQIKALVAIEKVLNTRLDCSVTTTVSCESILPWCSVFTLPALILSKGSLLKQTFIRKYSFSSLLIGVAPSEQKFLCVTFFAEIWLYEEIKIKRSKINQSDKIFL